MYSSVIENEKDKNMLIEYEKEQLFDNLFNKSKDGVVFIEFNEDETLGKVIDVNNRIFNKLGYTKEEFLNMSIYDVIPKDEIANIDKFVKILLKEKQIVCEYKMMRRNGEIIDVEVNGHVLKLDGKKIGLCIGRDITSRKIAERELKASEERYRKLIELLPDGVHIKYRSNDESKIVYSNEVGASILGFKDSDDAIGKNDNKFIHPDYLQLYRERGNKIVTIGENVPLMEAKFIRTDGKEVDIEIASTAIEYNNKNAILSVIRDISKRKKTEEIMKKMMQENEELLKKTLENERLKTEIFTNISHEFKTPLNVILGVIQLLNRHIDNKNYDKSGEVYSKYINMMKQNCYRLLRLINNLIDITKIDSGYLDLNFGNYNIINIVECVTLSVAEYAENRGLSIIFDTEIEERIIACDEEKIERIMLNLLSNAIKYSKETGTIYVNIYDNTEDIIISVKDTGIGIPKDKIGDIFERFKQVDTSLHRVNEGSGIGLALVKSLVEKHEGQIWVESNEKEGTEFFIRLPIKLIEEGKTKINSIPFSDSLVEKISIEFSDIYKLYQ